MANYKKTCIFDYIKVLIILLSIIKIVNAQYSPCPQYFNYVNNGGEVYGLMTLPPPKLGGSLNVKLILTYRHPLQNNFAGKIDLVGDQQAGLRNVVEKKPIEYKITFPYRPPPPNLSQLLYNNQLICSGGSGSSYLTTINLEHNLMTTVTIRYDNGSSVPFSNNTNIFGYGDADINSLLINYYKPTTNSPYNPPIISEYQPPIRQPYQPQTQHIYQPPIRRPYQPPIQRPQTQHIYQPTQRPYQQPTEPNYQPPNQSYDINTNSINEICGKVPQMKNGQLLNQLIINGRIIEKGSWPWLVAIYQNPVEPTFLCGGSLISKNLVVSAAHCFYVYGIRKKPSDIILHFGRYNLQNIDSENYVTRTAKNLYIHPEFNSNLTNFDADIVVVRVEAAIQFTGFIRPVCLWSGSDNAELILQKSGTVVGWGYDKKQQLTAEPNSIDARIVSDIDCLLKKDVYREIISPRTFCAGNLDGTSPCIGDSGTGFIMLQNNAYALRGITAVIPANGDFCDANTFTVYTDVAKFNTWINMIIDLE